MDQQDGASGAERRTASEDGLAPPPERTGNGFGPLVDMWWAEHFAGSPVARYTEAWNHAFAAKEALKRLLDQYGSH